MASLVKKKKGNRLYYYLVESARVDGKPRIVHQAYLGTAEKLAELIKQKSAPIPLAATLRDFGLPGALWLAAKQSGLWPLLESLWPAPRSGPGLAHYLLLAAIHRICDPGPKTEVSHWYERTILASEWGFPAERFTSQAFWDAFEQILPETSEPLAPAEDPLDRAQLRLLGLWKEKQLVGRRLLAYDTTNFYTYIASTNLRNHLAQRGHNKQGRHNLRQVPPKILLIENDPAAADEIRAALAGAGSGSFDVEWVRQLSEGLARLGKRGIDAVLLELSLPDSHGIETFDNPHPTPPAHRLT
jgi:CheY-like chemotaxis protein